MKKLSVSEILDFNLEPNKNYIFERDSIFERISKESAAFYLLDSFSHRIFTIEDGNLIELPYYFNDECLKDSAKYFRYLEPDLDYDLPTEVTCEATI
jgi:hypothetical protein